MTKLPNYKNMTPPLNKHKNGGIVPDRIRPKFTELSPRGLAVYNPFRSGIYYNDGENEVYNYKPDKYKWRSKNLVPDQTEDELKLLNEYMKDYEDRIK